MFEATSVREEGGRLMSTGLVHDYLLVMRGAERTFAQIAECWPQAPIYTLLYDEQGTDGVFGDRVAGTSYLQRLPARQANFRKLLPLFPGAAERLAVGDHDVMVSSSSAFAHGIRPAAGATHICYCHSPFRYAWHERERALREVSPLTRPLLRRQLDRIRSWDLRAVNRVDHFIANSEITRTRIADLWGRDSTIVHPPVATDRFAIGEPEDFFLIVGELVTHKQVGSALEAASRAGQPVKVVGTGPCLESLRERFGGQVDFLGRVDDLELAKLMARARALVVPNVEEFGIAAVEAQASGRPVVAPDLGGTGETVVDGRTGVLFPAGDFDALAELMRHVDFDRFDPKAVRTHALDFRAEAFRDRLMRDVDRVTRRAELAGSDARAVAA